MAFRSFTLNLSIILYKYFLKACATMTLISQFKSKFKTDCKAMRYELACLLPHFIFEHLTRRIRRHSPRAQAAVCQIFKYPGMQKMSPHQNSEGPLFFPLVSGSPTSFHTGPTDSLSKVFTPARSLTSRVPPFQQLDPVRAAEWQPVQTKPWGESFQVCASLKWV